MLKLQASLPSVHDAHCTCITLGTDGTLSVMAAAFENRRKGHRAFNEAQYSVPDFGRPLLMQDVGGGIFADRRIGFPIPDVASGDSALSYLITSATCLSLLHRFEWQSRGRRAILGPFLLPFILSYHARHGK